MTEWICGFAFSVSSNQFVALIRKARPDWQKGKLNGISGRAGETPEDAMKREWKEETGTGSPDWSKFCVLDTSGGRVHFFRAEVPLRELLMLESHSEEEAIEVIGGTVGEDSIPNLRWLVPMARDWNVREGVTHVFEDGASWCATGEGFTDVQESPVGFGETPHEALDVLRQERGLRVAQEMAQRVFEVIGGHRAAVSAVTVKRGDFTRPNPGRDFDERYEARDLVLVLENGVRVTAKEAQIEFRGK